MAHAHCRNLRTKKNYTPAYDREERGHQPDLDCYFCLRTLHAIGADDDAVGPRHCGPERTCFEALLVSQPA